MSKSKNGILTQESLNSYLVEYYRRAKAERWRFVIGGAFPGFHDTYKEAGIHNSLGYLDGKNGETFINTFQKTITYNVDVIQVVTWNDFGEGTYIEPTLEYGYRYLETIHSFRKQHIDGLFRYDSEDLRLPKMVYDLRKKK